MYTVNSTLKDEMNIFLCILLLSKYLNVRSNLSLCLFFFLCVNICTWMVLQSLCLYTCIESSKKKIILLSSQHTYTEKIHPFDGKTITTAAEPYVCPSGLYICVKGLNVKYGFTQMKDHCLRPVMFLCLLCIIKVRFKLHFPKHSLSKARLL